MTRRPHPPDRGTGCRRRGRGGPIKRVIRGLADVFGVSHGLVIAGFVLGFVFFPLLTLLMFFAALYWVDHPERTRRYADGAYETLKRATDRLWHSVAGPGRRGAGEAPDDESTEPRRPSVDPAALGRRFERLERRARAIEEFVASEEFRLNREFRRMGRK